MLLRMIIVLGCRSSSSSNTNCNGGISGGSTNILVNAAVSSTNHNLKIQLQQHHHHHHHPYRSKLLPSSFWMYRGGDNRRRPPPPPPLTSSSASFYQKQQPQQPEEDEYYEDPRARLYDEEVDRSRKNEEEMDPWKSRRNDSYYEQQQPQPNEHEYRDPRPHYKDMNIRSGNDSSRMEPGSSSSSSRMNIRNSQRPPIHYEFPAASQESSFDPDPSNPHPRQRHPNSRQHHPHQHPETPTTGAAAAAAATRTYSARSDPVTYYWTRHRVRMILSAAFLGASLGTFVGHALGIMALIRPLAYTLAALCVAGLFQRTSVFGELIRCLALVFLRAFMSLAYIRKQYPTHIAACLGGTRHPFPPLADEDGSSEDGTQQPPFPRLYAMIASGTVGSFVLGTFPLLPTWLGALAGFAAGSLATTLPDARGDLARTVGMRGVALLRETARLNRELHVVPKTMRFTEAVWDRLLFLDKQHRLKDRVVRIVSWMYTKATSAIQQPENKDDDGPQPNDGNAGDYNENGARRAPPRPRNYPNPGSDGRNRRAPPPNQAKKMRRDDAMERF